MRLPLLGLWLVAAWAVDPPSPPPPTSPPPPSPYPEYRPHVRRISITSNGLTANHAWGVVDEHRYYESTGRNYTCELKGSSAGGGNFKAVVESDALAASWGDLKCMWIADPDGPACSTAARLRPETVEFFVREGYRYSICGFSSYDTFYDRSGTVRASDTVTGRSALTDTVTVRRPSEPREESCPVRPHRKLGFANEARLTSPRCVTRCTSRAGPTDSRLHFEQSARQWPESHV